MTKSPFTVLLFMSVVFSGALLAGDSGPQPEPPTPAPAVVAESGVPVEGEPVAEEQGCTVDLSGLDFLSRPLASVTAKGCCIDHCVRDRDCDRICGAKGAGDCVRVNSCCNQCACLF